MTQKLENFLFSVRFFHHPLLKILELPLIHTHVKEQTHKQGSGKITSERWSGAFVAQLLSL